MEGPICRNCKVFFGCQDGLCSQCFRQAKVEGISEKVQVCSTVRVVEEVKVVKEIGIVKPDRCFTCKKLLGPVNFKCKCSQFFCMKHRHPEEHSCEYDFKSEGVQKLIEENPLVQAPKFNRLT